MKPVSDAERAVAHVVRGRGPRDSSRRGANCWTAAPIRARGTCWASDAPVRGARHGAHCRPMSERALISLQSVDKQFANGVLALHGVTLQVARAANSSRCSDRRAAARARCCGWSPGSIAASAGQVDRRRSRRTAGTAFVFQEPTLMPWASVFDNVWLPLRLAGVSRAMPPGSRAGAAAHGRPRRVRAGLSRPSCRAA